MSGVVEQVQALLGDLAQQFDSSLERLVSGTGFFKGDFAADIALAMLIGVLFPLGRWVMDSLVYEPIGRRLIGIPKYKKSDDPATLDQLVRLKKFKESFYKTGVQITFTVVLAMVAARKPWASNTRLLWDECTRLPCDVPTSLGERFIYCLELGFYTQAIPMLFLWETKRKDRWEVLAHHVATIVLLAYSYYLNLTRVGVMVLVCHEANDIFMELAKMSRYVGSEDGATTFFVLFLLSWIATRVLAFPLVVIRSTYYESWDRGTVIGVNIQPHWAILNAFLGFLYLLHVYWTYLILRIVWQKLSGGELDDIREDDENDAPGPKKTAAVTGTAAAGAAAGSGANGASPSKPRRRRDVQDG